MGDWLQRLPRAGGGGGGGKRVVRKKETVGGRANGGSKENPFSAYRAPGTASESSDDDEAILQLINAPPPPPPPPTIPKRPGAGASNASRGPQGPQWVERASASKPSVPVGAGGREEMLKARAKLQPPPSAAALASSESDGDSAGGGEGKKRGRLRRRHAAEEEDDGDVLVSPPLEKKNKKKAERPPASTEEGGTLVIDLDDVNRVSSSSSSPVVLVEDGEAAASAAAAAAAGKKDPEAEAEAVVEVMDDSDAGEYEEEEEEDGYDEEERAERARAQGMLRACELISDKIRAEVAGWGAGQKEQQEKRHAEDRLDLTTMAPAAAAASSSSSQSQSQGKTAFVRAELLARACPGVELKAYQLTGLNWLFLLHQLDLDDIPRGLLPGGGGRSQKKKEKKRQRLAEGGGGGGGGEEPLRMNGVLADDMGLGKTCQTIAFLAYLRELQPDTHTHLIVVPASVLSNWEQEFARFAPNLEVWVYHGGAKERKELRHEYEQASRRFREHVVDVVLATYSYWEKEACADDRRFLDKLPIEYLVLDEGHSVKNTQSGRFARLRRQRARRRLVLSGTPVQNHVKEMLALLAFLNPRIVDLGEESSPDRLWELLAGSGGLGGEGGERAAMARLKRVFAPFVLRRLKTDVLDQLTAKVTRVETVALTEAQRQAYDMVTRRHLRAVQEAASRRAAEELSEPVLLMGDGEAEENDGGEDGKGKEKEKEKGGGRARVLRSAVGAGGAASSSSSAAGAAGAVSDKEAGHIFTEWRKAASHPLLLRRRFSAQQVEHMASVLHRTGYYGWDCSLEMVRREVSGLCDFELHRVVRDVPQLESLALPQDALFDAAKCRRLRELVPALIENGHRVLLFSAWTRVLDILQQLFDEVLSLPCLRLDGSTPVTERQALIDQFNAPDSPFPIFLLSTRAGGMGINLTSADTVILYDTDWNPAVNDQAVDRCHRIGQTKPVTVHVLVAADTVDETIYRRAAGKKEKSESLLDKDDGEEAAAADGGGRRDASGSSEISKIVQAELAAYLEHRKNLPPSPDSDAEDGEEEDEEEGLGEYMTVDDDDEEDVAGEGGREGRGSAPSSGSGKKAAAKAAAAARPPSRASSTASSGRRESTESGGSSRKRQSYSVLEGLCDSEESDED